MNPTSPCPKRSPDPALDAAAEPFDRDRIEAIAARLTLREPNKETLERMGFKIARHYDIEWGPSPFRAGADVP